MSRDPSDRPPPAKPRAAPARPISRRERWLIRGLLAASALLVIVSLTVTLGKDAVQSVIRRWESGQMPIREINPSPLAELPPPVPDLGLPPPPQISALPEIKPSNSGELPGETAPPGVEPAGDEPALVVNEPVFDGHMLEPESLDDFPGPLADSDVPEPDRNLVDELMLEGGQSPGNEPAPRESAPQPAALQHASARDRIKYASVAKRVLKFLVDGNPSDQPEAAKSFAEARRICSDDARLPLAYGLYLQQIGDGDAAREAFEDCAGNEGKPYLLIHQAAAMSRLQTHNLRRAWPHLEQLAEAATRPVADGYPEEWQRRRAAEWLGAAAAFVESLPEDVDGRPLDAGAELRGRLSATLQPAFDAGRAETGRHLQELARWDGLPAGEGAGQLADAIAQRKTEQQQISAEVDMLRETLREVTAGLRAASETEKKARGELNLAGRQRRLANEAVNDLSQPRTYSYTQTTYSYQTDSQGRRRRTPTTTVRQRAENSSERSARLAKLQEASAALAKHDAALPGLKAQHDQAKSDRDALSAQVREQTSDLRSQLVRAQRQLHQDERLLTRLQELAADPEKLSERLKSPTLALDWNAEEISERLRATFETPGKTPAKADAE